MNITTRRFPRTLLESRPCDAQQAIALHKCRQPPLIRRFFYALMRWGWAIVPALLAVSVLTGCEDLATAQATAADVTDAQVQAKAEWQQLAKQAARWCHALPRHKQSAARLCRRESRSPQRSQGF